MKSMPSSAHPAASPERTAFRRIHVAVKRDEAGVFDHCRFEDLGLIGCAHVVSSGFSGPLFELGLADYLLVSGGEPASAGFLRRAGGFQPITSSALHRASASSEIRKSAKAETFAG